MCCEKFQSVGADKLLWARNLAELLQTKDVSCTICAVRNLPIECSQCRIQQTADCLQSVMTKSEVA